MKRRSSTATAAAADARGLRTSCWPAARVQGTSSPFSLSQKNLDLREDLRLGQRLGWWCGIVKMITMG